MPTKSIYKNVVLAVIFLVCACDGRKSRRKVDSVRDVQNYLHDNKVINKNSSDSQSSRGFFVPGGLFTLGKVLNFFPVGGERECTPTGYKTARAGICLNPYDCRQRDGHSSGDCAHGLGVCCVFEVSCGGVVQNNLTYFVSPGFPELWTGERDCGITIEKAHAGIMQLRIDFVHFTIGQPNRQTGECDEDVMVVGEGEGDNEFRVCGQNHGQHIYYTLPTKSEAREDDELPSTSVTRLSVRMRGTDMPRLWILRLAQLPLAHSAPHDCRQYYTENNGTIKTFNYAVNGRYLANHEYKACVRRNKGVCSIRYSPCDSRSFRIGPQQAGQNALGLEQGPGGLGGPGTGFYGPDGAYVGPPVSNTPLLMDPVDQQGVDTMNDVVQEEMMPADGTQTQEDQMEGSGADPQIAPAVQPTPVPSMASRIWSFITWPWQGRSVTWSRWSPYAQHFAVPPDDRFRYSGYGSFGMGLFGFGRMRCQDRITIPCENEYFVSSSVMTGVCDPHHCGSSFCPGAGAGAGGCHVETSITPFAVSVHFGPPALKSNPEENIGACLRYMQMPCET